MWKRDELGPECWYVTWHVVSEDVSSDTKNDLNCHLARHRGRAQWTTHFPCATSPGVAIGKHPEVSALHFCNSESERQKTETTSAAAIAAPSHEKMLRTVRWSAVGAVMMCLLAPAQAFLPNTPAVRSMPKNVLRCSAKMRQGGRLHGATTGVRMQAVDDKTEVREYFNNEGFNR